jgi:hypothetical protein
MSRIVIVLLTYNRHKLAIFILSLSSYTVSYGKPLSNLNSPVWAKTFSLAFCCRTELDIKVNK